MKGSTAHKHPYIRLCRRVLLKDDGAVTVFAVIVLASLLLFFSLLIDYARIATFHKLTEDSVRSGVRSVLSAYDAGLYERYGLFGRGGTEGQQIFEEVLKANTGETGETAAMTEGAFKPVRPRLEASALNPAAYLGDHEVFQRQVLEEMKYKAPVDFTMELAAKFAPMADAMKEASVAIDLLEKMRRLYEKREAHLGNALQLQRKAAETVDKSGINNMIPVLLSERGSNRNTAQYVASEYRQYAIYVMHDQDLPEGSSPKYTEEIREYERMAGDVLLKLQRLSKDMLLRHDPLQALAIRELEEASLLNDEMAQVVEQARQAEAAGGYDAVSNSEVIGSDSYQMPGSAASEIEQVKQAADELILPLSWFQQYRQELYEQDHAARRIAADIESFEATSRASMQRPIAGTGYSDALYEGVEKLRSAFGTYEANYIHPASVIVQRQAELDGGNVKAQLRQQEEKAGSLWKQARKMLNGFNDVPQASDHTELFEQVKKRYNDNLLFNQQTDEAGREAGIDRSADAHEAAEQSSAWMGGLFTGLAGMLEQTRDSIYFGEYVVDRYSHFAPQHLRSMITEGNVEELSQAISLNNQETEYILYGFHNPVGNIAAAYGELFATRLAIRTMEGLIESRSLGHPLLILSAALIYGLEKTMEDMLAFASRGSAPLSKYVRVELTYVDYLRLFMLMHGVDEAPKRARMIAVIEQNLGTILSALPSGVTGEANVSMELWFVPGLMSVLGRFGLLEGKVAGNRYETTQTIGWSY